MFIYSIIAAVIENIT